MALLQPLIDGVPGEQITIPVDRAVMGRHPECDIVLDAAAVSRQHAQILTEGENYFVEDLHSRNGTFVNGKLVQGKRLLADGDRLKICDLLFTFYRSPPTDELRRAALLTAAGPAGLMTIDSSVGSDGASLSGSGAPALDGAPRFGDLSLVGPGDLFEEGEGVGNSTIMSKVDVAPRRSGAQAIANPEMKLRAMIEIAQNLARAVTLDEVLPKLLDSLFKIFLQADRGFILLRTSPGGPLVPKAIKYRRADMEDRVRISRTIVNQAMETKEAILSADAASDQRFESSQSIADLRIRSVMCAPLIDNEGHALGVIQIDTLDQRHRFQKDDLDVLASIAAQAGIAIDNAQMHETALKRKSLELELELAHKVQRGLLPAAPPRMADYHFFDFYEPANQVGGDYYDYIELSDNRLAVVLGDVSGKGVSAALLMAKLSGEVRFCLASEPTAAGAMNRINAAFCRSGWDDRFVTFILVVVDPVKHEVTVVNAGHMAPLLRHGGPGRRDRRGRNRSAAGHRRRLRLPAIEPAIGAGRLADDVHRRHQRGHERSGRALRPRTLARHSWRPKRPTSRASAGRSWTTCGVLSAARLKATICAWFRSAGCDAERLRFASRQRQSLFPSRAA